MKDKLFDTSILVYAFDKSEPKKRKICKKMIENVFKGEKAGTITNQILGELFSVLTKKIENSLSKEKAGKIVNGFVNSPNWEKINYKSKTVEKAIEIVKTYSLPFWNSLIIATMFEKNIFHIITEDKDFRKVPNIKITNPF